MKQVWEKCLSNVSIQYEVGSKMYYRKKDISIIGIGKGKLGRDCFETDVSIFVAKFGKRLNLKCEKLLLQKFSNNIRTYLKVFWTLGGIASKFEKLCDNFSQNLKNRF